MAREGGQQHKTTRKTSEQDEPLESAPNETVAERKEKLDDDVDAILDEIDDVLETNAEDFVKSFIQKGGQ
jgi:prokaryotic ubiquitin-like protein Pup